jgi:hypothetical protein
MTPKPYTTVEEVREWLATQWALHEKGSPSPWHDDASMPIGYVMTGDQDSGWVAAVCDERVIEDSDLTIAGRNLLPAAVRLMRETLDEHRPGEECDFVADMEGDVVIATERGVPCRGEHRRVTKYPCPKAQRVIDAANEARGAK